MYNIYKFIQNYWITMSFLKVAVSKLRLGLIGGIAIVGSVNYAYLNSEFKTDDTLTFSHLIQQYVKIQRYNLFSYTAYKSAGNHIIELKINPWDCKTNITRASNLLFRTEFIDVDHAKFRTSKANVISIEDKDTGDKNTQYINSDYNRNFKYEVGKDVEVAYFYEDVNSTCSQGIHYYLTRETALHHGRKCGSVKGEYIFKEWDEDGRITDITPYKDGRLHGKVYHKSSYKTITEGIYVNGQAVGVHTVKYISGQIMQETTFLDKHNTIIKEFYDNGNIKNESTLVDGKYHGLQTNYHYSVNGKVTSINRYEKGEHVSTTSAEPA